MIVEVNDTDKILRVAEGTDVEEFINFVAKMGYIRGWKIGVKKGRKTSESFVPNVDIQKEPLPAESVQENSFEKLEGESETKSFADNIPFSAPIRERIRTR